MNAFYNRCQHLSHVGKTLPAMPILSPVLFTGSFKQDRLLSLRIFPLGSSLLWCLPAPGEVSHLSFPNNSHQRLRLCFPPSIQTQACLTVQRIIPCLIGASMTNGWISTAGPFHLTRWSTGFPWPKCLPHSSRLTEPQGDLIASHRGQNGAVLQVWCLLGGVHEHKTLADRGKRQ